jgi:predicted RNA-binding Zn-ribbon protein involved in translation (DUF1610 family)
MKYQCNVCGAQKDLPEHASDFFVNGQPVCLSPSLTTPGVCRGKLEPMPIWSKGMKFTCVTCGVDTIQSEREMLDSKWARQVGIRATELAGIMRTGKAV